MDKHTKKCLTIIGIIIISMACVPVVKEDTDPSYFVNVKKNDFTISEKGDVVDVYITSNYDNIYVEDMSPFFAGRVKKSSHNDGNFPAPANTEHKVYYYTFSIEATYNDDGEEIAVTINNGDEEITVYVSAALELTVNENEPFDVDDDHWGWHVDYTIFSTITLRAPQSYDGMLLEIDTTGWTEADHLEDIASGDDEAEVAEGDIFTDDLNDCRFTRASDLIIEG